MDPQTILNALVDPRQFCMPILGMANIVEKKVRLTLLEDRMVDVLEVHYSEGLVEFALSKRTEHITNFGNVIVGYQLERGRDCIFVTKTTVIIKISQFERIIRQRSNACQENPMHEVAAMQLLGNNHPNLKGIICAAYSSDRLFVVMNYPSPETGYQIGDMQNYLDKFHDSFQFGGDIVKDIFRQIMIGVDQMHQQGIAHRDISLENILVTLDDRRNICNVCIIDFGLVYRQLYAPFPPVFYGKLQFYRPPECFESSSLYQNVDPKSLDIWACGIILFMLVTGQPPFDYAMDSDPNFQIIRNDPRFGMKRMLETYGVHGSVQELLCDMLRIDPVLRPRSDAVLEYEWLTT